MNNLLGTQVTEIELTIILRLTTSTSNRCHSKAFFPVLVLVLVRVPLFLIFTTKFFVPHEHLSQQCKFLSRQGQTRFFLPLRLRHVFLQLRNK